MASLRTTPTFKIAGYSRVGGGRCGYKLSAAHLHQRDALRGEGRLLLAALLQVEPTCVQTKQAGRQASAQAHMEEGQGQRQ